MIKQISWGTFLFYLAIGISIYYFFVMIFFYQKEISIWLKNPKKKIKNTSSLAQKEATLNKEVPLGESYDYGDDF